MAKAFISFLGTGNYTDCMYTLDQQCGDPVKYVQEDIIRRFCSDWRSQDEIRIFTTDDAKSKNWDNDGHIDFKTKQILPNMGLGHRLNNMKITATLQRYNIPMGNSEDEIWEIFQIVFDALNEGDEIIFDITHGFRSIPMLFMTLIGYARMLKNITVSGIYYGAFEVLGHPSEVSKMPMEDRIAPIFDLTSFEQLIEWTEATQSFVKNGSAHGLKQLAGGRIKPILKETQGQDHVASAIRDIVNGIDRISRNLMVNRGAEIITFDYDRLRQRITTLKNDDIFIKPLGPLMSVIESKIDGFAKNDIQNGFKAVEWCVEHGLYQQAITMLQENLITFILTSEGLDWGVEQNRDAVSDAFFLTANKSATLDEKKPNAALIQKIKAHPLVQEFSADYETIRPVRNDINHGGFLTEEKNNARTEERIIGQFNKAYRAIGQKLLSREF